MTNIFLSRRCDERAGRCPQAFFSEHFNERNNMKRGMTILLSVCVLATAAYFTASKWAIRHTTLTLFDPLRTDRPAAGSKERETFWPGMEENQFSTA